MCSYVLRVVAKPLNFPEESDIRYETLDRETRRTWQSLVRRFSWEEVKRKFSVGEARALEWESQLGEDESALIAQAQEWESGRNPTRTTFGATCTTSVTYVRRSR